MIGHEGEKSLAELMAMGVKLVLEGKFQTGQKIIFNLKDGTPVEGKIGGLLADGSYLVSYQKDGQDLGRKMTLAELKKLSK